MGNDTESHYTPLLNEESESAVDYEKSAMNDLDVAIETAKRKRTIFVYRGLLALQSLVILVFVVYNWSEYSHYTPATCSQVVYCKSKHIPDLTRPSQFRFL